jgi:hypothetical protein
MFSFSELLVCVKINFTDQTCPNYSWFMHPELTGAAGIGKVVSPTVILIKRRSVDVQPFKAIKDFLPIDIAPAPPILFEVSPGHVSPSFCGILGPYAKERS